MSRRPKDDWTFGFIGCYPYCYSLGVIRLLNQFYFHLEVYHARPGEF